MENREETPELKRVNEYLYIAEAADLLGVHRTTLLRWGDAKKIPVYYNPINSYRMYKREDLEEFLRKINKTDYKNLVVRLGKRYLTPKAY